MAEKYANYIYKDICNRNHEKQGLREYPIFLIDSDNNYILEEIEHRDKIELEIDLLDYG